jgi:uncharacterized membrane protein
MSAHERGRLWVARAMTSLLTGLLRGTAAGAAGATALDVTTQVDMALRARPGSDAPTRTVSAIADRAGVSVPGRRGERTRRLQGLGGLAGAVTGMGVGALAGALRAAGVRLPAVVGAPLLGAGAMAASDLPMSRLGVTEPRRWSRADWVADAVPHLVYGMTTHATLTATFAADERARAEHPTGTRRAAPVGTLARAAALGAATGARSSAGMAALACRARRDDPGRALLARPVVRAVPLLMAVGELGADKSRFVPPRNSAQALAPRVTLAAASAEVMTRREQREGGPAALVAAACAVGSALGGMRLREEARRAFGSDLPGALLEDGVTALLAWVGTRRPARIPH